MEDGGISFPPNEVCHAVNSATRMWHSCTESVIHEIFDWLQDIMLLVATILRIDTKHHASYLKMDQASIVWSEQLHPATRWSLVIVLIGAILQQCLF